MAAPVPATQPSIPNPNTHDPRPTLQSTSGTEEVVERLHAETGSLSAAGTPPAPTRSRQERS